MTDDKTRDLARQIARLMWQPVGTAPVNEHVELGRWDILGRKMVWRTDVDVARKRFLGVPYLTWKGELYTHWRPAPPPPAPEVDA